MKIFTLPISFSPARTLEGWAAEIRGAKLIEESDYNSTDWQTIVRGGGGMTIAASSVVTLSAKFTARKKLIEFELSITFTTGGAANNVIYFSLPKRAALSSISGKTPLICSLTDGGEIAGHARIESEDLGAIRRYDNANFGIGAGRAAYIFGCYRAL